MNKTALIPVDYENTFVPENEWWTGELWVLWGWKLAPFILDTIREVRTAGWLIIPTRDMHPEWHISFVTSFVWKEPLTDALKAGRAPWEKNFITYDEVKNWTEANHELSDKAAFTIAELQAYLKVAWVQAMWPEHGEADKASSEYFWWIEDDWFDYEIKKWHKANEECYSGFGWVDIENNTPLAELLKELWVKTVKVLWLATDYCVKATALDALKHWFDVELLKKWIAGVDPATTVEALKEMREAWVKIIE